MTVLVYIIKKDEEAEFHLKEGLKEAQDTKNALAIYLAAAPLAFKTMPLNDGISKAHEILRRRLRRQQHPVLFASSHRPGSLSCFMNLRSMDLIHFPNSVFKRLKKGQSMKTIFISRASRSDWRHKKNCIKISRQTPFLSI